jgi:hypothetical protein
MSVTRWSGTWHIVNLDTGRSLESWPTEWQARYFCNACNEHEHRNARRQCYAVEEHPQHWRRPEQEQKGQSQ